MLKTRLRDVKRIVANSLSLCATDTERISSYVNRACERLLYEFKSLGTYQRCRFCVTGDGCITLPRELETVEAFAIDRVPGVVRSGWFEFLEHGPGLSPQNGSNQMIDQGEVCSFDNVIGLNRKLAIYCDKQEASGTTITLQFTGSNGEFVTSTFGGNVIDGERIVLPAAGTYAYTINVCQAGGLARVYRDETLGRVRLFEYNTTTTALRPLAVYQRDEITPVYRKFLVPGICKNSTTPQSVTVVAKLRFIPAYDDDDYLCISHPEAIRLMCQAIQKEENSKMDESMAFHAAAMRLLERQLHHFQGDGEVQPIAMSHSHMPAVQNLI